LHHKNLNQLWDKSTNKTTEGFLSFLYFFVKQVEYDRGCRECSKLR